MTIPNMVMPPRDERPVFEQPPLRPVDALAAAQADPVDLAVLMLRRLRDRRADMLLWDAYYRGDHPMPWFTDRFRSIFRASFRHFRSNFTQLVVDGISERLEVQGFSFLDAGGDADLWEIWQDNNLDGGSQQAHTEALIKGACYTLVEPRGDAHPTITIEDALCAITLEDPRDRRRSLAGLKTWTDDTGRMVVYLYLPDEIHTFRTLRPLTNGWMEWLNGEARMLRSRLMPWTPPGQDAPTMVNPLGVVPLVPLLNRPLLDGVGRSEIDAVTSNQDAINFIRGQALISTRYMAVPTRYIYGLDLAVDPATGRPERPFVAGDGGPADIMVMRNPDPDSGDVKPSYPPQIGQFDAADLGKYIELEEAEIGHMAAISRLPFGELLGESSTIPQSGEGRKSTEGPLVRKLGKTQIHFGEGWEETMRVALRAMGDPRASLRVAETLWQGAETREEAVRTDSVVKQTGAGIIDPETALEELGYTPARVSRIKKRLAAMPKPVAPPPPVDPNVPAPTGPQMSPVVPAPSGS
jgi:hypothetical protein